jgi:hypothetical protein
MITQEEYNKIRDTKLRVQYEAAADKILKELNAAFSRGERIAKVEFDDLRPDKDVEVLNIATKKLTGWKNVYIMAKAKRIASTIDYALPKPPERWLWTAEVLDVVKHHCDKCGAEAYSNYSNDISKPRGWADYTDCGKHKRFWK